MSPSASISNSKEKAEGGVPYSLPLSAHMQLKMYNPHFIKTKTGMGYSISLVPVFVTINFTAFYCCLGSKIASNSLVYLDTRLPAGSFLS